MKRVLILIISVAMLLGLGLAAVAAEDPAKTGTDVAIGGAVIRDGVSYASDTPGWTIYFRPGVRISNHDRVIGYFDFLVPLYFTDKSVLFFNPKANFDNNENVEWNVGVGYRHLLANDKLILGGNIYYDGRRSYTHEYYHQIGLGAEVLTEWVNARVNGYISLSDARETDRWREYYFGSTSLNYSWAYNIEEPMSGLDYEIGFKIPGLSNYVETWVYGGGYNYFSDYTDDMAGWSARVEVVPADFVKLNFTVRDDNLRDTEYAGEVALELPFSIENLVAGKDPFEGIGDVFKGSRTIGERLYEQVRRDVDITINTIGHTRATTPDEVLAGGIGAIIPDTGTEITGIIYVDSSNTNPTPDGSLANPFTTIEDALNIVDSTRNTVFVFPGAGPYDESITLLANMNLWGSGYDMFGMGLNGYPIISSVVNSSKIPGTLNLNNNVELFGFELTNGSTVANSTAISATGVSNLTIGHNIIRNNAFGIYLDNTANVSICNNQIYLLEPNTMGSNLYAIYFHGGGSNITIKNNSINTSLDPPAGLWSDTGGIMFDGRFNGSGWDIVNYDGATITDNEFSITRVDSNYSTIGIYGWYEANVDNFVIKNNNITLSGGEEHLGIQFDGTVTNSELTPNTITIVP